MKLNSKQTKQLGTLLNSFTEIIKMSNQGTSFDAIFGKDFIEKTQKISKEIKSLSINYYDCEGVIVAAIKVNESEGTYTVEDYEFKTKGFKIKVSDGDVRKGHLENYTDLWRIVDRPISADSGKIIGETILENGRKARAVIGIYGTINYCLDRSPRKDGTNFREITEKSKYYQIIKEKLNA